MGLLLNSPNFFYKSKNLNKFRKYTKVGVKRTGYKNNVLFNLRIRKKFRYLSALIKKKKIKTTKQSLLNLNMYFIFKTQLLNVKHQKFNTLQQRSTFFVKNKNLHTELYNLKYLNFFKNKNV